MKTKLFILAIVYSTFYSGILYAQATIDQNDPNIGNEYLGWDINTNQDLNIRHDGPYPIVFSTNQAERMRLNEDGQLLVGTNAPVYPGFTRLEVLATGEGQRGIAGSATGPSGLNIGGYFQAFGGQTAIGVRGESIAPAVLSNYGVYGEACNAPTNYSVYGQACEEGDSWAGYFVGKTFSSSGSWDASDAQLKTNVNPIENATDLLMAIKPKTYEFLQDVPGLQLAEGLQYGLLAHELAEVVPHAVTPFSTPPVLDEDGNLLHASEQYLGVNYTQLIPLLIAGFKEQQVNQTQYEAKYTEALNKLVDLHEELKQLSRTDSPKDDTGSSRAVLRQNVPNPFAEGTEIIYELAVGGLITLEIADGSGRSLQVLASGHQDSGVYWVQWDTAQYASGIYYCILRSDKQLETIKLIKK